MDETRALLDALMGPNRNKAAETSKQGGTPDFADRNICKHFLVGFCPHDWFSMPKRALMPCSKIHSELLKENFEKHPEVAKYRAWYEEDFLNYLQPIARDCDTYIVRERAKCRPKAAGGKVVRMPNDVKDRFDDMESRYADLVKKSEEAADESLSLSKELMGQAMVLKEELDTIKAKYTTEFQGEDICETCGVKYPLGTGGAEWHDKESHKKGKTHQGFKTIRETIDELLQKRKDWEKYRSSRKKEYEPQLQRERESERPKERERERSRPTDRDRERGRDRDRSRGKDDARQKTPKGSSGGSGHHYHKEAERDKERDRERRNGDHGKRERSRSRGGAGGGGAGHHDSGSGGGGRRQKDVAAANDRSRSRRRKDRGGSSERSRSRRHKAKEKAKGAKSDKSSDGSRERTGKSRRRSPELAREERRPDENAKAESSSDEESQPEDEKDGITVLEEDLPEFWERVQKLKADVRNEAVAVLSTATKERLEKWLLARVRKKAAA